MTPIIGEDDLAWPFFTIEEKEPKGHMRVAMRKKLYNAAIMLSNFLESRKRAEGRTAAEIDRSFFNKIHVIGVEVTDQIVSLSCYLVTRSQSGVIRYHGTLLQTWALFDRTGKSYTDAQSCISKALDRFKPKTLKWVLDDTGRVEEMYSEVQIDAVPSPPTLSSGKADRKAKPAKASALSSPGNYLKSADTVDTP
ncbi:hypothetical protein MMC12_007637 [Toensbergia leucococca]|nr:hypothetical protein [Toensbergia leucococca]